MIKSFVKRLSPNSLIALYHLTLAFLGAVLANLPSRKLVVIGVTGTNGKSTVVYFIARLLEDAGYKVAASSTIEFQIGERRWPNTYKMTMPGRFFLQKFLRQAVDAGCQYAVIEVTSEGILQHRHRFIDWDVAAFLNLSPEHIERHGSYEKYRAAKGELFQFGSRTSAGDWASIVNLADKEAGYFLQFPADRYFGFRLSDKEAKAKLPEEGYEIVAEAINHRSHSERSEESQRSLPAGRQASALPQGDRGGVFTVRDVAFPTPLLGKFNIENWLAAIAVGLSQGLKPEQMAKTVAKVASIPGRLEEIPNPEPDASRRYGAGPIPEQARYGAGDRGIRIFVDYAHTPAALESVYKTLKPLTQLPNHSITKLLCVLGAAGGGRDKWKRPELGKIAAQYCDHIILTNEDPYDEKPLTIIEDIERGFSQIRNPKSEILNYEKIIDRREAIKKAISMTQPGDIVIITGKGSEPWMMVAGGKKIPWDDREVVRGALARIRK